MGDLEEIEGMNQIDLGGDHFDFLNLFSAIKLIHRTFAKNLFDGTFLFKKSL